MFYKDKITDFSASQTTFAKNLRKNSQKSTSRYSDNAPKRHRKRMMSDAKVITILIYFHFKKKRYNFIANRLRINILHLLSIFSALVKRVVVPFKLNYQQHPHITNENAAYICIFHIKNIEARPQHNIYLYICTKFRL